MQLLSGTAQIFMNESKTLIKFNHGSPWPWCIQLDTTLPPSQRWKQRWLRTHREGNRSQSPAPDAHCVFCFLFVWLFFRSEKNGGGTLRTWAFIGFLDLKMLKKYYRLETFPIIHHTKVVSQAPRRTIFHSRADRKNHGKTSWVLGEDVLLPGRPRNSSKCHHFKCWAPYQRENNVAKF